MSGGLSRVERKQQLLLRIDQDRAALGQSLQKLASPMRMVERWQGQMRQLWPTMIGLLVVVGVIWVCLRALRGNRGGGTRISWMSLLQRALIAYRFGMQLHRLIPPAAISTEVPSSNEVTP